ncbi:hypothetical protein A9255_02400 [Xenorhabdus hominickii]|nr:hypothetical protein A9255_02400 [Xenorhabdus hominickii]
MTNFTVRIEMKDATAKDYEELHRKMAINGYAREVRADDGRLFKLPDAEYCTTKGLIRKQIIDEVMVIVDSVTGDDSSSILVLQP